MKILKAQVGLSDEDKLQMKKEVIESVKDNYNKFETDVKNMIDGLGTLTPSGTSLESNILAFTENKGIWIGTDTGHWYYFDELTNSYTDGGVYQATELEGGNGIDFSNNVVSVRIGNGVCFDKDNNLKVPNLLNATKVEFTKTENYRIRGDGVIYESTGHYYSSLIPLSKGERLYVKVQMPNDQYNALVSKWTDENTFVKALLICDTTEEMTLDYKATEDCYIRLCGYNNYLMYAEISSMNDFYYKNVEPTIKETARSVTNEVAIISNKNAEYDKIENYYIHRNGTIIKGNSYYYSTLIELKKGETLNVVSEMPNDVSYSIVSKWTDENTFEKTLFAPSATGTQTFTYIANEEIEYIRICGFGTYTLEAKIISKNEDNFNLLKQLLGIENPLENIKWDCFGDSLTALGTLDYADNYTTIIANKYGIDMQNNAVGGKGWWNGILQYEIPNLRSDTNIVTIFGSFNDIANHVFENIGTISDTPNESGSLYARMKNIIEIIITTNPVIKIGIITPTPWYNYNYFSADTETYERLELYVSTLKEVAKIYGIPVLDLFHESNMKPWITSFKNTYYKLEWDSENQIYIGGDGVHPNTEGHRLFIVPKVEAFLKSMIIADKNINL